MTQTKERYAVIQDQTNERSRHDALLLVSRAISQRDWERLKSVASRSETTVDKWLRNTILSAVACDEAHFEEMAQRESAAQAVDRESLRLLLNGNGHGTEPSEAVLDLLVEKMAIARSDGRAGLEIVARKARDLKIAADLAFEKPGSR
jgi:hypothetical protein